MASERPDCAVYIGDGIYAKLNDNKDVVLTTGSHIDEDCDNRIVFEPRELQSLLMWLASTKNNRR